MIPALAERTRWPLFLAGAVLVVGMLVAHSVLLAAGLLASALVLALAVSSGVLNLVLIVFTTVIVPFSVQNRISGGERGLIPSDILLLCGLTLVVPGLVAHRWADGRERRVVLSIGVVLAAAVVQFVHGLIRGNDASIAGAELRTLLGLSTFLIALPILSDERRRRSVFRGLLLTALALGVWGMLQWLLDIRFEGEFGVREGINFTRSGRGQLQGGLYAFPVAAVLGFAVLISGAVERPRDRLLLIAVTVLNLVCLILTYERTFWVATALALGLVTLRAGRGQRSRALLWGPAGFVVLLVAMATLAPGALTAARERLVSLGQYADDGSVRYRIVEARQVVDEIMDHPLIGAGLGAEVTWSRPWEGVPVRSYHYVHNGYLWAVWKLGLPAAAVLVGLFLGALVGRAPPGVAALERSIRTGAQAALLLLLVANVTFPTFNTYGITATVGVLLAVCASRLGAVKADRRPPAPPVLTGTA